MIRNVLSVLIFLFTISFVYIVGSIYLSDSQKAKYKINREAADQKIKNNTDSLPVLSNDTHNVIIYNSGFEKENFKRERNFWQLFKKND
jgi:hypothetical protein